MTLDPWLIDLDATVERAVQSEAAWKDLAHHALTESEVADQHEGRFLVELLQNVRDAWCMHPGEGSSGSIVADRPARAALIVTDRGLLVADQGAGFDLEDQRVLDAVRYLRRSSKRGPSGETRSLVGHWGIGLKAILRRCQAFQVWSHVCAEGGSPRRVAADFRRSRSLEALRRAAASAPEDVRRLVEQEVAFVPMFRFSHPLPPGVSAEDEPVVRALLGEVATPPALLGVLDGGLRFNTVVRLDFRDEAWLDALGAREDDDRVRIPDLHADEVWREVAALDLRTVLLLGTLGTVDLVRLSGHGDDVVVREHVCLTVKPLGPSAPLHDLGGGMHRRYRLACSANVDGRRGQIGEWDVFAAPAESVVDGYGRNTEGLAEVCIAVPRAEPAEVHVDLPLFMYYPVQPPEAERGECLPFLLHGPFLVKPDRTGLDLGKDGRPHNAAVLGGACRLVVAAALALVREQVGGRPGNAPWNLLPAPTPLPDGGLVAGFRCDVFAALSNAAVLASAAGTLHVPASRALLATANSSTSPAACAELAGLFEGSAPDLVADAESMRRLDHWVAEAWSGDAGRAATLLGEQLPAVVLSVALARWASAAAGEQAIRVTKMQAAAVAAATLAALRGPEPERGAFLQHVQTHDLPVVPCVDSVSGADDEMRLLVRSAASRRADGGQIAAKPRVVLYRRQRGDAADVDDGLPLRPPKRVPLYLLDEPTWRPFADYGHDLGLREEGGDPILVEEVLARALPVDGPGGVPSAAVVAEIGGYLGSLLDRIARRSERSGQEWLDHRPTAWLPVDSLWRAVNPADAGQLRQIEREASRWRNRMRATAVPLPTDGGSERPACETYLPLSWVQTAGGVLAGEGETGNRQRAAIEDALRASARHHAAVGALAPLAGPRDPRWDGWRAALAGAVSPDVQDVAIARVVLFFGAWVTPRVEARWLWPMVLGRPGGDIAEIVGDRVGWDGLSDGDLVPGDLARALDGLVQEPMYDHQGDVIHYAGCSRQRARRDGPGGHGARVIRQAWFPDSGDAFFAEAVAAAIGRGWLERACTTRWTCRCDGRGQRPSQWPGKRAVPTLAGLQARRSIRVEAVLGTDTVAVPLEAVVASTGDATDETSRGLRPHLLRWRGEVGGHSVSPQANSVLPIPDCPEMLDGQQAASALAALASVLDGTVPTGAGLGALVLLLRRALAPAADLLQGAGGKWTPASRAVLGAVLARARRLPVWVDGKLAWSPIEGRPDLPAGLGLMQDGGLPVAALGTRREVTRYDRERLRGRVELLDPDGARHDPLPRRRELLEGLGVEVLVGTPPPGLIFAEAPGADPAPYREFLARRLPVLRAIADGDREKPIEDGVLDAAAASLRCVSGLAETRDGDPIPVPSAWHIPDASTAGALLVDVERVPPAGTMGDLAWGLVGAIDAHVLLPKFMVALAVEDGAALDSVARALGVQTHAATGRSRWSEERRCWLAALEAGGEIAKKAETFLTDPSMSGQVESAHAALPDGLRDDAVTQRGVLGVAALSALLNCLDAASPRLRPEEFLAHAHLRFLPTSEDLARGVPGALRRIAAMLAWSRTTTGALAPVAAALSATEAVLRKPTATVADALSHLVDADDVPAVDDTLGRRRIWFDADSLIEGLHGALDRLGLLPPEVAELLEKPSEAERESCVQAHARAAAQREEVATSEAWAALRDLPPPSAPLTATSLVAARRTASAFGGGNGPSIPAQERGEMGEIAALRDVVARLLAAWASDPDRARESLSQGLAFAARLRPGRDQAMFAAPAAHDLLTRCAAGERAALDDLVRRLDVSDLRGPGFDLVDPLGPLSGGLSGPARIEVKTTAEPIQGGSSVVFRLTVNELYRSQQGDEPYLVRVYHAPPPPASPRLQVEIPTPASLIDGLTDDAGRVILASVRGGGHLLLTAVLAAR